MNNPQPRPLGTRIKKALPQYLAISPYFFFFFVFGAMPVVFTMALAFTNWSGLGDFDLVGFTNFKYLISDPLFYKSLVNTLILWVMGTVPTLILATILALMLNSTLRFSTTYKVIYLIPNITSMVAMGMLFSSIFSSQFGIANAIINVFGFENIAWLQTEWGIKIAISCLTTWAFVGYNALLILAGLQAIDKSLYEAAARGDVRDALRFADALAARVLGVMERQLAHADMFKVRFKRSRKRKIPVRHTDDDVVGFRELAR